LMNSIRSCSRQVLFSLLVASGAAADTVTQAPQRPAPLSVEGQLALTRQSSSGVEGRFSNRYVSNLAFRAVQQADKGEVVLTSAAGAELLRVTQAGDIVTLSVYNGEARTIIDMRVVRESARQAELPEDQRTPFPVARGVQEEGDEQAFERFTMSQEARA